MTKKWDKTQLENFIFYLASQKGFIPLYKEGRLLWAGPGKKLAKLAAVYNRFFEKDNKRFLKNERRTNRQENVMFAEGYYREKEKKYIKLLFHLPGQKS